MKHTNNAKRSRGRGGGKKHSSNRNHNSYESAGPEGKLRGSPQQILDKYLALARDAQTAGDRIACEGYYQHAEHFYRVINTDGNRQKNNQGQHNQGQHNQGQRNQGQRGQGPQPQAQQPQAQQPQAQQPQAQQPQEQQSPEQKPPEQNPKNRRIISESPSLERRRLKELVPESPR